MKLYLSGPMRRVQHFNFPAFDEGAKLLREMGHEVFNPADQDRLRGLDLTGFTGYEDLSEHGFDLRKALTEDLTWILNEADGVILLPGWKRSRGALAEVATATAVSVPHWTIGEFRYHARKGREELNPGGAEIPVGRPLTQSPNLPKRGTRR